MSARDAYIAEHPLDPDVTIEAFASSPVTDQEVLRLWTAEAGLPTDEAARRIGEVLLVAVERGSRELTGVFTAGLRFSAQLDATMWYGRAFVTSSKRTLTRLEMPDSCIVTP